MAVLIVEFGLEPDRRAIGDDLQIMIGQPRQQRTPGHLIDMLDVVGNVTFAADRGADVRCRRVDRIGGEIEQHAMVGKGGNVTGLEILDRRIVAAFEQGRPVIVGAHVHAALIGADAGVGRDLGDRGGRSGQPLGVPVARQVHALSLVPKLIRCGDTLPDMQLPMR